MLASTPRWSFLQDRRVLVPCFSISHSPGPHSFRPVLSTNRCKGSASPPASGLGRRGWGTSTVAARRLRVVWSGTRRVRPSRPMMRDELTYTSPGSTGVATKIVVRRAK